jgi:hypothetical protein
MNGSISLVRETWFAALCAGMYALDFRVRGNDGNAPVFDFRLRRYDGFFLSLFTVSVVFVVVISFRLRNGNDTRIRQSIFPEWNQSPYSLSGSSSIASP